MMLLIIINFTFQSAIADNFYNQELKVIFTIFFYKKLKKRKKNYKK